MKLRTLVLEAMAVAMLAIPAAAHHSYAMFDRDKTVEVEGTVKKFLWTNPHSRLDLLVTDAAGQSKDWTVELSAPAGLVRNGWTPKTLTPGMKVKLVVHPLRDGGAGGQFKSISLPDGKQLGENEPPPQN